MSRLRRFPPFLLGLFVSLTVLVLGTSTPASLEAGDADSAVYLPFVNRAVVFGTEQTNATFLNATDITNAGDGRLFVVERAGQIKILHPDGRVTVFLDLLNKVASDTGELGMFALVFHPDYAENGRFFITYTEQVGDKWQLRLAEFTVSANPDLAELASEKNLVSITQDFAIHNGGSLVYNPRDGYLYMGTGEDSQFLIAQGDSDRKGKVLQVQIDDEAALMHASEPMVSLDATTVAAPFVEVKKIARGLRNPWRMAVNPFSGDLFIGDVGDRTWEEINVLPFGWTDLNYGWPCMEGPDERLDDPVCNRIFNMPIFSYSDGCSVIAGKFYFYEKDYTQPTRLIFADACSNNLQMLRPAPDAWYAEMVGPISDSSMGFLTTFGEDADGTIYAGFLGNSPLVRFTIPPLSE